MAFFPRHREGHRPDQKPVAQETRKAKEVVPPGYEAWKPEGKPVEIFSKNEVLAGIWDHCAQSRQTRREVGGMLFGTKIFLPPDNKYKVYIEAFEPMVDPNSSEREFSFKGRELERVCQLALKKYPRWSKPGHGFGIGWYHTHLNPDSIFFSPPDRSNHSLFCQVEPNQVALVVHADTGKAGFFINEEGEIKQWHRSYHEFFIENLAERVKRGDI